MSGLSNSLLQAPPQAAMGFGLLSDVQGLSIYQKTSKIEAITAAMGQEWERPNRYEIKTSSGEKLFYAQEETGCCRRQMKQMCPDCMSWEIKFHAHKKGGWLGGSWEPAFDLHRNFQISCCCINPPRAALLAADDHSHVLGYIQNPFCHCCPRFEVQDRNASPVLVASTSGCQPGLYWPMPCGPCRHVRFQLHDAQGEHIGEIDKEVPCGRCCCKWLAPGQDVDNYHIDMSRMHDPGMKALAMALAVFIDFRYFSIPQDHESVPVPEGGEGV